MQDLIKNNINNILEFSFENSNQAIYLLSKEGKLLYANNSALEGLGYTLEELLELHVWDIDGRVDTKEKYFEAIKTFEINGPDGKPNILENFHKRKNGEIFPVEIISKFIKVEDEEILISYVRDITRRLKRNQEINLYFNLIDSSQDLILLVNHSDGKIQFVNDTACKKLGYSLEELKGKLISEIRKPMEEKESIELPEVFKKIEKLNSVTTFGKYITKDKKEIPVETSLHLKDYNDEKYIVAVSRDISERIEIESKKEELNKKLKDYNKTLQKEVEIAKQELIEYEDMMKRQSKMAAMGEMIENIAHQWRQPLSAVSVLSTGMILQNEQDLLNKDLLEAGLNDINEQVQYLSKTIDDFRNFLKPGKAKTKFNIKNLINTSIKLSNARHNNKLIDFVLELEDIELNTHENELLQVLLNLISNAKDELVKKKHKKYVFIETKTSEDKLFIRVKDNAGGIDKYIIDRIFEPYFTTKHNYQGTGIGLYMSENIVKHMNGKLSVENINLEYEGCAYMGACFEIELPLEG